VKERIKGVKGMKLMRPKEKNKRKMKKKAIPLNQPLSNQKKGRVKSDERNSDSWSSSADKKILNPHKNKNDEKHDEKERKTDQVEADNKKDKSRHKRRNKNKDQVDDREKKTEDPHRVDEINNISNKKSHRREKQNTERQDVPHKNKNDEKHIEKDKKTLDHAQKLAGEPSQKLHKKSAMDVPELKSNELHSNQKNVVPELKPELKSNDSEQHNSEKDPSDNEKEGDIESLVQQIQRKELLLKQLMEQNPLDSNVLIEPIGALEELNTRSKEELVQLLLKERKTNIQLQIQLTKHRMRENLELLQKKAKAWIEAVTEEKFMKDRFGESLRSGVLLCKLVNIIEPDSVKRVNTFTSPFMQMENINHFLEACEKIGVPIRDLFSTSDLYERRNLGLVAHTIYALAKVAEQNGFEGPSWPEDITV